MERTVFRWKDWLLVTLAMALAWGLRGQHGHERGAAMAGAMAGLVLAVVTGGPRWIGAAVLGSFGFAIGGGLSYGRFIQPASQGSLEAVLALGAVGFAWGGLGALLMGLGLALSTYRVWERTAIAGGLLLVWVAVDRLLWGRIQGPADLATRELMAGILLAAWLLLALYIGVFRADQVSFRLGMAGGIGFGVGFPLAAWIQGAGPATGLPLDWWNVAELAIGAVGGLALAVAVSTLKARWALPLAVRPWRRWLAFVWLLWLLPAWLIANNLDFWIAEKALLPVGVSGGVWAALLAVLAGLTVWGATEIRRGRTFTTSWMPKHLKMFFLLFLWIVTVVGCSKTWVAGVWNVHPVIFLVLAGVVTWLVKTEPHAK